MSQLLKKIQALRIEDFAYPLKEDRIAKHPVEPRDSSKLLLYRKGELEDSHFRKLPDYLENDSLLIYNNTKVIHARLLFFKETGAKIEIFCLEPLFPADYALNFQQTSTCEWLCMVGNLKKWKQEPLTRELVVKGRRIRFTAEKLGTEDNIQRIRFNWENLKPNTPPLRFGDLLDAAGQLPIPPYLNREAERKDETSYQTVYSRIEGSVAAPTAGLHFTPEVLQQLDAKGIQRREVTLHVGAGTFQPVLSKQMQGHTMHSEFISVERNLIEELISNSGKIVAVGTTTVRTLESLYWFGHKLLKQPEQELHDWTLDQWYAYRETDVNESALPTTEEALSALLKQLKEQKAERFTASTRLLIAPGFRFRVVNAMITNFHQPNSTLLLLVSAFLGGDEWKRVYNHALNNKFRFLSYGDSSLLVP
jgi:S-adenosylmethionine:tRNA ribosyltransferase-isomerase